MKLNPYSNRLVVSNFKTKTKPVIGNLVKTAPAGTDQFGCPVVLMRLPSPLPNMLGAMMHGNELINNLFVNLLDFP